MSKIKVPSEKWVLLVGNPLDGVQIFGPFEDVHEAVDNAEVHFKDEDWWVCNLMTPWYVEQHAALRAERDRYRTTLEQARDVADYTGGLPHPDTLLMRVLAIIDAALKP